MAVQSLYRPLTAVALAIAALPSALHAQQAADPDVAPEVTLEPVQISGNWLGSGLQNSVKSFAGARTVVQKSEIEQTGAASIGDAMRRIPGVQATENSGTAGSAISLNVGVRGLTGRYSPRSTVLLDGIPLAVAPYGQPQLSFAPVSLNNIESVDVVRGGGAVRYGPQNVGGIINFNTRPIPASDTLSGDATVRYNDFSEGGGHNTQYSLFLGRELDNGLGLALLYSGLDGSEWRAGSDEKVNDLAVKFRQPLGGKAEVYGKVSYYDVTSRTPGGLTPDQYDADPFQNTRPTDYWSGVRKGIDLGYLNPLSATQEAEVRLYYNESSRASVLTNGVVLTHQPRNYRVLGIEPRYTQRLLSGAVAHDVTLGYRFIRERGDDNSFTEVILSGAVNPTTRFDNETDAHAVYVDDRIAIGDWRITPGVRFEHISSTRIDGAGKSFETDNDKALPSLNIAWLVTGEWTLFGNYNTSFGPVQNIQLNSQTAANPLKPEVAKTFELGTRWKSASLSAELTAFRLRFDNQIQQVPLITPATFRNVGETKHDGIETAIDYRFDKDSAFAGLNVFANYTHTRALQASGDTAGNEVPFYSRDTDTVGARYVLGAWAFNLSSTHQTSQYADNANTWTETANAGNGLVPGYRLWNAQVGWKLPTATAIDLQLGVNNLADKRYYTRNVDGNAGRMVGAPRTTYVQARVAF
ncbi:MULTISPECIES: TonB-dependent siderophore receptor [unclassified Rhizobacter]|uniref:TonB-dependent receptor family protein n=1 Tax=unclassified Rhizobacter TaxID=2640088 RepID=UPI0006F5FCF0|nr:MULTISPECIES: TonB-dependent siderophore receptor [unclassified Rhizobacter]KQU76945.1 iron transporter [Rhizobacter sp. Root29]KQV97466.1 iron transporter [Rhizobacter sp. Root1238]KRB10137.1 iron transporter [Rhizobacter sp. Root16D2]